MKTILSKLAILGFAAGSLMAAEVPAMAHHSYAMFDRSRTVKINGTVKLFQWTNPHMYLWVTVKDDKGVDQLWGIEGSSPNSLSRMGWNKHTLDPGDKVTVELQPLKDGRNGGFFVKAMKDGKDIVGGPG
jgi:hypothetical protein